MVSAKHSPGVSTAAMALTRSWPGPVMLIEADPAGGDTPTGMLRGSVPADHGVLGLAMAARSGQALTADVFLSQCVSLGSQTPRLLLPGLHDPAQAAGVSSWWSRLAPMLQAQGDMDVIADCGRLGAGHAPEALWQQADLVVLVLRPQIGPVHLARLWLRTLAEQGTDTGIAAHDRLALLLVDDPSPALTGKQVVEHTSPPGQPPLALLGSLPHDAGGAAILSGAAGWSQRFERSQFMRTAADIARNAAVTAANNKTVRSAAGWPSPTQRLASGAGNV
jgi:hypothetical protein